MPLTLKEFYSAFKRLIKLMERPKSNRVIICVLDEEKRITHIMGHRITALALANAIDSLIRHLSSDIPKAHMREIIEDLLKRLEQDDLAVRH